ncbi:MAG: sulfatase-like hydrolase/transferase [Verrucomicrobiota bacterium]
MNRRSFLKTAAVTSFAALALPNWLAHAAPERPGGRRPNIIVILADDVGLGDLGCYGGRFKTPAIDALAAGGTRFEYSYATPLCGPSRCQLLTGRYPFRTGLNSNGRSTAVNPTREVMIPTMLKKAGYVTACVGKWGQIALGPREWGFDESLSFLGNGRYWREQTKDYIVNGKPAELLPGQYLPDLMHKFLVDFLTRHKAEPFFVYYPLSHVHTPIVRTPDSQPGADGKQLYADNIAYMDKLVGQLVSELERLQVRDNTLVIFAGDNGSRNQSTLNGRPIFGTKETLLEGGSRVPLIANWPGTTPAGRVNHDLTDFSDFFATIGELGGATLPTGVTLDSRSFAPQLKGQKGEPREWVYVELNGAAYVRDARFKLTNAGAFFDLKDAPFAELPVPADTTDDAARAVRKRLQAVLDQHPAAPASGVHGGAKAAGPPK